MFILKNKFVLIGVGAAVVFLLVFLSGKLSSVNPPTPTEISQNGNLDFLKIQQGFKISIFAKDLDKPRVIAFDPKGIMFVSEPQEGKVLKLEDKDNDGLVETKTAVIENLRLPHGLAFYEDTKDKKDYLYIAETHQVKRYEYDLNKQEIINPADAKVIAAFPAEGRHFTRTIAFGPNYRSKPLVNVGVGRSESLVKEKLYMSVGSSCDVCLEDSWKRAAILESDPPGNFTAEFAGGLRNAVFFVFHPVTKEIWATEMGRDNLGDNLPPDEINIVKVATQEHPFGARRYGWPFCYGNKVEDKSFKPEKIDRVDIPINCSETEQPIIEIPAHSAPLGLAFVDSKEWPSDWQNNLLVAYHGSWNRSEPTGYKIVRFRLNEKGEPASQGGPTAGKYEAEDFINGWLHPSTGSGQAKVFGRPVDLKFGPDSSLYVSDDSAGIIYKVTPTK